MGLGQLARLQVSADLDILLTEAESKPVHGGIRKNFGRCWRWPSRAKGYTFSGFPILDEKGRVVGILTSRDVKFSIDPNAPIADVMTRKVITAPPGTTLQQAFDLMQQHRIGKLGQHHGAGCGVLARPARTVWGYADETAVAAKPRRVA